MDLIERTLQKKVNEILEERPYCGTVLGAFRPLLIERNRQMADLKIEAIPGLRPGDWNPDSGVPLIRTQPLCNEGDPWRRMAVGLTGAIEEGFPDLGIELDKIKVDILGNRIRLYEYFRNFPDEEREIVAGWAVQCGVREETLRFLLLNIARIVLTIRAKEVSPVIRDMQWDKGSCPICGASPMLSILRDKAQRWLHCSVCAHEWRFSRVACPFCNHESPSGMNFYFLQDRQDESAYACEECKHYLVAVNRPAGLSKTDPDIVAISLLHLDLMMQQRGFLPVAECGWNVL